ncbi:MAG: 50S ribosomal protein L33 [Planctomycetota bacterium]
MKIKERYVFLVCTGCETPGKSRYTTHKRQKAAYKLQKNKYCRWCRKHTPHKEKKL